MSHVPLALAVITLDMILVIPPSSLILIASKCIILVPILPLGPIFIGV